MFPPLLRRLLVGAVALLLGAAVLGGARASALTRGAAVPGGAAQARALTPPPEGWGAAYERAAIEYWGEPASRCATTDVTWDSPLPERHRLDQRQGPVLGRATITSVPGGPCQMWIAPLGGRGIYFRCVLFAHEYGHWIGHPDSPSDPQDSVRSELLGSYTQDAPCRRLVATTRRGG